MVYSRKVSIAGLFVGLSGITSGNEVLQLSAFIIISAACVCRSIEENPHMVTQEGGE